MKDVNLHAAILYTKIGWKVFALRPKSKAPLTLHGFQDATADESLLRKWWDKNPACGVGIATGNKSGILVVDVDPRNQGDETFEALELEHGEFPETVEALTGGGGKHLIYKLPPGVFPGVKNLWQGVDIKSDGGYICAPFSVHPNGLVYKWVDDKAPNIPGEEVGMEIAPCPQWILNKMAAHRKKKVEFVKNKGDQQWAFFAEGGRNDALTSLAGSMRRRGMLPSSILVAMLAENEVKCSPPLLELDVQRIVDSVCRYEPDSDASPVSVSKDAREGKLLKWADPVKMAGEKAPPVEWLLKGWMAKGDCSLIFGPPAIGKSWVTLDIALTLATGKPTFGILEHEGEVFKVLLVDEENPPEEVWRRINCIATAHEIEPESLSGQLFVTESRQGFTFKSDSYIYALQKEIERIKPDLVILDSITALSSIKNESDAIEVRSFFHDKLYPLQKISNCAFLCVHHSTKGIYAHDPTVADEGLSRGSIDFQGATDSVMMLRPVKNKDYALLKANKIRRGKKPANINIKIRDGEKGGCRPIGYSTDVSSVSPEQKTGTFGTSTQASSQTAEVAPCVEEILREAGLVKHDDLVTWASLRLPDKDSAIISVAIRRMLGMGKIIKMGKDYYAINPRA